MGAELRLTHAAVGEAGGGDNVADGELDGEARGRRPLRAPACTRPQVTTAGFSAG